MYRDIDKLICIFLILYCSIVFKIIIKTVRELEKIIHDNVAIRSYA